MTSSDLAELAAGKRRVTAHLTRLRPADQTQKRRWTKASRHYVPVPASTPHHVMALDYEFDETTGGIGLKILKVTGEFAREALAVGVGRVAPIDTKATVKVIASPVANRGAPAFVRCDNVSAPLP